MKMEVGYNHWDINIGDAQMDIKITEMEIDRGGQLGKTIWYGSTIDFKSSWLNLTTVLSVTDPKYQDCKGSFIQILTQHSRQIQLGTFGKVTSPHNSETRQLRMVMMKMGDFIIDDNVSDFVQIPFVNKGGNENVSIWEGVRAGDGLRYKAYRKYVGPHYITKIQREAKDWSFLNLTDDFNREGIVARKETIEIASLCAEPLLLTDTVALFN